MYQLNLFDNQRITSAKRDLLLKQALPCRQDTDLLKQSSAIISEAISSFNPYAIVAAVSGGDDSMAAYYVAKMLGVKLDFILHVNTRTGIPETTQFVRHFADKESMKYIEGDAGNAYESRVLEKGFFGLGRRAHNYAYHILKQRRIEHELSKIRKRKRGRNILIINGVRKNESDNRRKNFADDVYRHDGSNIWVNLIHYWEKSDCLDFLADCKACRNPVSKELCRSGECMCVAPSTLISTPGGWKPIALICPGDLVNGLVNNKVVPQKVFWVHRNAPKLMFEVKPQYRKSIFATANHPILVRRFHTERKKEQNYRPTKVFSAPEYKSVREIKSLVDTARTFHQSKKEGYYMAVPVDQTETPIELTEDQLKLIGYFASEGAYNYKGSKCQGLVFTVSLTHSLEMGNQIEKCLKAQSWHVHRREWTDTRTGRRFLTVRTNNRASSDWMKQFMSGRYCYEKDFKPQIMQAPIKDQTKILEAMWEGDGSDFILDRPARNGKKSRQEDCSVYSSTSLKMALQVQEMLIRRGEVYGLRVNQKPNKMARYPMYQVGSSKGRIVNAFWEDHILWVNINSIQESEECEAWNLTIDGQPNYITPSGVTHNCGTMQSQQARLEAAALFPEWGQWLDELERKVKLKFPWGWGQSIPKSFQNEQKGQMRLFPYDNFQPMCSSCIKEK